MLPLNRPFVYVFIKKILAAKMLAHLLSGV